MRLFFAVLPPVEVRDGIAAAALRLPLDAKSALVRPDNYHMTLAFVGEVPAAQLAIVRAIGESQHACSFTVRFDAYEYWPEAAVLVAAARDIPSSLARLWERLHAGLAGQQLARKPELLRPHVTIARKVSQAPVLQAMTAFAWKAQTFSLMQSNRNGVEPTYTVLNTWSLLDEGAKP
ncbi:MAG TPA: RNA 2',3'-cyclic phosphodiesterase [Steroidobacteraceae bacterium]|nr:RNA 2',3'-cyclic phosphodiesterase [Steroidobacteraceae bacterium]